MEGLLTPIQTRNKSGLDQQENHLVPLRTDRSHGEKQTFSLNSPEDALEILKSKPGHQELNNVLRWLNAIANAREGFNIKTPGPIAAQIVYVLVNDIVPDYWADLSGERTGHSKEKLLLIRCLSSVTGIGAIVSRLRLLLGLLKVPQGQAEISGISRSAPVETLIAVLQAVFDSDGFVASVWNDINSCISQLSQKSLQWKEFVSLVASGKVLSTASEASFALDALSQSVAASSWVGNGIEYATWLGRNVQHMISLLPENDVESDKALSQLLKRALSLGYTGQLRGEGMGMYAS